MTTTATVSLAAGVWTQLSTGSANVTIEGPPYGYRVAVGTSAPLTVAEGLVVDENDGVFSASGLVSGDNVYATPYSTTAVSVVVIKS